MHLSNSKHDFVAPSTLVEYSYFSKEKIDNLFASLTKKNLLVVKAVNLKYRMEFKPLFEKIASLIESENKDGSSEGDSLIALINDKLLTPMNEQQIINFKQIIETNKLDLHFCLNFLKNAKSKIDYKQFCHDLLEHVNKHPSALTKFNWLD